MNAPAHDADWTRTAARPAAAIVLSLVCLGALPRALSSASPLADTSLRAPDMRIDLNAATRPELVNLPGIGESLAAAILEHRAAHGRFETVDALDAVKGIGPRTIDDLRPFLVVR